MPAKQSRGEPTSKRKKASRVTVAVDPRTDEVNPGDVSEHDDLTVEDFQEWFGDGEENIAVQVYRLEPKFYAGERVDGYLGDLQPTMDPDEFRRVYGGQLYSLRQKVNGRFTNVQRRFRVSGPPVVDCPPTAPGPGDPPKQTEVDQLVPTMDVNGVAVPLGDFEMLKQAVLFKRTMDQLMPEKPDLNLELIRLLMTKEQGSGDLLAQADQLAGLASKLRDLAGSGSGGSPWVDLGREALGTVGKLIDAKAGAGIPALPVPNRSTKHQVPGHDSPRTVSEMDREPTRREPGKTPETTETLEVDQLSALAEKAAAYIVQGFLMEPQQSVDDTVTVLDTVLGIPKAYRPQIVPYRDRLRLVTRSVLTNQVEVAAADLDKLDLYFNSTFDSFLGLETTDTETLNSEADNVTENQGTEAPRTALGG